MTLVMDARQSYDVGETPAVLLTVATTSGVLPGDPLWPDDSPYPNGGIIASSEPITIYRIHPDGTRWKVLTDQDNLSSGVWVGYDYHAPFNRRVTYMATTAGDSSAASRPVFLLDYNPWMNRSPRAWLIHATDPTLSVPIDRIIAYDTIGRKSRAGEFQVLGTSRSVHLSASPLGGQNGKLTLTCESQDRLTATLALLDSDGPILINTPFHANDIGWLWAQPGDIDVSNVGEFIDYPYRRIEFAYVQSEQPDIAISTPWTYATLAAAYTDYTAVNAAYATNLDVQLDRRQL